MFVTPIVIAAASPGLQLYPVPRAAWEVPAWVERAARQEAELAVLSIQVERAARLL